MKLNPSMRKDRKKMDPLDPKVRAYFGKVVRKKRESLQIEDKVRWSRKSVGERIGVGGPALGNMERGVNFPSPARLIRLINELGLRWETALPRGLVQSRAAPEKGGDAEVEQTG